jgi:hypothetical protein
MPDYTCLSKDSMSVSLETTTITTTAATTTTTTA